MMNATDTVIDENSRLQGLRRLRTLVEGAEWQDLMGMVKAATGVETIDFQALGDLDHKKIRKIEKTIENLTKLKGILALDEFDVTRKIAASKGVLIQKLGYPVDVSFDRVALDLRKITEAAAKKRRILEAHDMVSNQEAYELAKRYLGESGEITLGVINSAIASEERQALLVKIPTGSQLERTPINALWDMLDDLVKNEQEEDLVEVVAQLRKRWFDLFGRKFMKLNPDELDRAHTVWEWYHDLHPTKKSENMLEDLRRAMKTVEARFGGRSRFIDFDELSLAEQVDLFEKHFDQGDWSEAKLGLLARRIYGNYPEQMEPEQMSKEQMELAFRALDIIIDFEIRPGWRRRRSELGRIYRYRWGTDKNWLDDVPDQDMGRSTTRRREQLARKQAESAKVYVRGNENGRVQRGGQSDSKGKK